MPWSLKLAAAGALTITALIYSAFRFKKGSPFAVMFLPIFVALALPQPLRLVRGNLEFLSP